MARVPTAASTPSCDWLTCVRGAARSAIALFCVAGPGVCPAQSYPVKPVRYVVTGSPGSSTDVLGRFMADGLTQQFGRQFVVENRTGAGSNIGPEFVSRSPADGYTLLQMTISHAVNATLYRAPGYDIIRDFSPVTQLVTDPAVLAVHPSLPAASVGELIRLAKGRPDALAYASGGTGTFTFLAAELFSGQAGIKMLHVPYKGGGPALTAVIAGEVAVYFAPLGVALPHVQNRRLRPLGVTTLKRLPLLPAVPTVAEAGLKGYEAGNWFALVVPARTPRDIVAGLYAAALAVLRHPAAGKRLNEMAYVPVGSSPDELAGHIRLEVERLGKIVRALNLSAE